MTVVVKSDEAMVGRFSSREEAEAALAELQTAGYGRERFSLMAQSPTVPETKARDSGVKGAIAGSLLGAIVGLILSSLKLNVVGGTMDVQPMTNLIGMALAGSLVGAAALGLIAAMSGVNVRQDKPGAQPAATTPDFLLLAKEFSAEELAQVQKTLQRSRITRNVPFRG